MTQVNQILFNEISKLSFDKVNKAMSFIRFLERETEPELLFDTGEEDELYEILSSGEMIDSADLLAKIKGMPND
ncbi:MAG: hypothetical protein FWH14_05715 [Oscillospiraceae bacterium]|nr:hypothetical protein [Oscillospiraceae bacterium]